MKDQKTCGPHIINPTNGRCTECGIHQDDIGKSSQQKAIDKAREKEQEEIDFNLCIKHKICPECAKELKVEKVNIPPIGIPLHVTRDLECTGKKCDFKHTEIIK